MQYLSTKTRVALSQGGLVASILLIGLGPLRLVPDYREAVMQGRAQLCEAIAVSSSLQLSRTDWMGLEATLRALSTRNPNILSAAVRRLDGRKIIEIGDHSAWQETAGGMSTDTQVQVPLHRGTNKWGHVELRFRPLSSGGLARFLRNPYTKLVGFVSLTTLLIFIFYLDKILEQLNPSKVVPPHVRTALNTLAEGLLVLDRSERVVFANDAVAVLLGKSAENLVGMRAAKFPWLKQGDGTCPTVYPWTKALLEERQQAEEMRLRAHTGEPKTFVVNCAPLLGHDGSYRGVLASLDDVTHLEEHKRELSKSKEEAEAANRAKSEFLARMSHEIRTPMNAILGFTDVLRRGFDCDRQERQDYLNTIHASGQYLLNIINDILDLSKVEAGKLETELLRVSPVQLISEVVSVLRVRAQEKGIALEYVLGSAMPQTILTDSVRLRQMLMNLLGNAIKFTEIGGVKVVARLVQSHDKPKFVFEVIDTGIGIAKEGLDKIFQPFAQADTSITRRFGGTGLGLTICQRFADLLGAQLSVESEVGVGSIFTLTLDPGSLEGVPILDPQAAVQPPDSTPQQTEANVQLSGLRVLVVDDGNENR
jgi:PAS domain S-box-containing protein